MIALKISNFRSIGNIAISLNNGVFLVTGCNQDEEGAQSNDSGKSNLIYSIIWALSGQLPILVPVASIIRRGQKECRVGIQTSDLSVLSERNSNGIKFSGVINSTPIDLVRNSESQEYFLSCLGLPLEKKNLLLRLASSIYVSAFSPSILALRSDTEKVEFVRGIIDVSKYEKGQKNAKIERDRYEATISVAAAQISVLNSQLNELKDVDEQKLTVMKAELDEITNLLQQAQGRIDINILENKWEEKTKALDKANNKIYEARSKLEKIKPLIVEKKRPLDTIDENQLKVDIQEVYECRGSLIQIQSQLKAALECPSCKQLLMIDGDKLALLDSNKLRESEQNLKQKVNAKQYVLTEQERINQIKTDISKLETEYKLLEIALRSFLDDRDELEKQIRDINDQILTAKTEPLLYNIVELRQKEAELFSATAKLEQQINQKKDISTRLADINNTHNKAQEIFGQAKFWAELAFPEIMEMAYDRFFQPFEQKINEYLEKLGIIQRISISISEKKSFDVKVISGSESGTFEEFVSRGKERRIQFATILAMRDIFPSPLNELLLMDEFLDGCDTEGVERIADILHGLSGTKLIVVNNNSAKEQLCPDLEIKLTKRNGVTSAEQN